MKIGICEDEIPVAQDIEQRVSAFFTQRGYDPVIEIFTDGTSLLASAQDFSLVFLDCRLPDGNGLEVARILDTYKSKPIIVFISAYKEYVFESFEVNAYRYLVKPVDNFTLNKTLNSFLAYYNSNIVIDIPTKNKRFSVNLNDVIYIESAQKHSIVRVRKSDYLPDTTFDAVRSLAAYTKMIDSPAFFRTHKRFFVNMRYIEKIENNLIILSIGERVEISRRKSAVFHDAYNHFLRTSI